MVEVIPNLKKVEFSIVLQLLATIFCLSPPNLFHYRGLPIIFLVYGITLCIAIIINEVFYIYQILRMFDKYGYNFILSQVLQLTCFISSTIFTVLSIVQPLIIKRKLLVRLTRSLKRLETELKDKCRETIAHNNNYLWIQLLTISCLILCGSVRAFLTMKNTNYLKLRLQVYNIQMLSILIFILQIQLCTSKIRNMVVYLQRNIEEKIIPKTSRLFLNNDMDKPIRVEPIFFLRKFDDLCDIIDMVSDVFGFQIVAITTCIILNVLFGVSSVSEMIVGEANKVTNDITDCLQNVGNLILVTVSRYSLFSEMEPKVK